MKKVSLILAICLLTAASVFAQEEQQVVLKKVSNYEVPKEVIDAVKRDFPASVVDQVKILPADGIEGWKVTDVKNNLTDNDVVNYYAIEFYGDGVSGEVLYNDKGEMVLYKKVINDEALPPSIRNYIGTNYEGWAFIKDKEVIKKTPNSKTDVYSVTIKNGSQKKTLHFNAMGKLIEK